MTINRAVLRKESYLGGRKIDATWPFYGLPGCFIWTTQKSFALAPWSVAVNSTVFKLFIGRRKHLGSADTSSDSSAR